MIRAVIFDFNGVLVDDEPVHCDLLREVLAEEGVGITEAEYHETYLGYDDRACFEAALASANQPFDRERIDELIARKAMRYAQRAEHGLPLFPGAAECVAALGQRWPLAVCSGALRPEIELALEQMGVRKHIISIVAAEDTTRCKPDPQGYLLALESLRVMAGGGGPDLEPSECLVVEDSLAGIASARAAGMPAVGVVHTYTREELESAGASAVLERLALLTPEWVERTFAAESPITSSQQAGER